MPRSRAERTVSAVSSLALTFASGTLELRGLAQEDPRAPTACKWDPRTASFRAPASAYADVLRTLVRAKLPVEDLARGYTVLEHGLRVHRQPRPYQQEALDAWQGKGSRGVVVLPTGAGKSQLACMAIDAKRRSTLVVAPTLDLVRQWYDLLRTSFGVEVGVIGGGEHSVEPLTVTTYDSAFLHMEHLGRRFGLLVFDECHHLPSAAYATCARMALAPFRLGLTATLERADGKEALLTELIGELAYRKEIIELAGDFLAEYDTERVEVELAPDERAEHDAARATYRAFVERHGIRMSSPRGWADFLIQAARSAEGREAMLAYRRQRALAFCAPAKLDYLEGLLARHVHQPVLIFTADNATCYAVARRFLIPAITHQTKIKERSELLSGLAGGRWGALVTSKVLNEGVDIPAASVAVVLSGSGSVREHVQRLGRILRKQGDKRAVLYELVTAGTVETFTSERRREHVAYR